MSFADVKALTFDTGGTILDWHTGFRDALAAAGARHGETRIWAGLANELRKRSLGAMLNLGEHEPPAYNFDGAHRMHLDDILAEEGLDMFDESDRHAIAYEAVHNFRAWPDFPDVLPELQKQRIVVSFTILSYRIAIDTAKRNGFKWDAVLSCEGYGFYKLLPQAYLKTAELLQLEPHECCMVACHPFDRNAAKACGFKTAMVRRPTEWGPPDAPNRMAAEDGDFDLIVDDFPALLAATS
ncbi:MAG: HAD family hydrolase [Pseudomonadota bacterium]